MPVAYCNMGFGLHPASAHLSGDIGHVAGGVGQEDGAAASVHADVLEHVKVLGDHHLRNSRAAEAAYCSVVGALYLTANSAHMVLNLWLRHLESLSNHGARASEGDALDRMPQ